VNFVGKASSYVNSGEMLKGKGFNIFVGANSFAQI